jgi:hypothetical protein
VYLGIGSECAGVPGAGYWVWSVVVPRLDSVVPEPDTGCT